MPCVFGLSDDFDLMRYKIMDSKRRGKSLFGEILSISIIPLVILAVFLTAASTVLQAENIKGNINVNIKNQCNSFFAALNSLNADDFSLNDDHLMKGDIDITENTDWIDQFSKGNNLVFTVFYKDTRYATTIKDASGKRLTGTQADPEIYKTVMGGKDVSKENVTINGRKYFVHYSPLSDSNGIIGMVLCGEDAAVVNRSIRSALFVTVGITLIVFIIALIVIVFICRKLNKAVLASNGAINDIAGGLTNIAVDQGTLSRPDELGDIARNTASLGNKLNEVITGIRKSSDEINATGNRLSDVSENFKSSSDGISQAVDDISKGALSQAEEIENASNAVDKMGHGIEDIVRSTDNLSRNSTEMSSAGSEASQIIEELGHSNEETMSAITKISDQINATNDSAKKISEAIQIITSIAEETNLLSLNASIEAARAGDQGRGFAVVANQIQKLAEQSNESAHQIDEITKKLLDDSVNTVNVMNDVKKVFDQQAEKFSITKEKFDNVQRGIEDNTAEIREISKLADDCNKARINVIDVISNLSAISEENAASAEETTSSMQELNATIGLMADSATSLKGLANKLDEDLKFFK